MTRAPAEAPPVAIYRMSPWRVWVPTGTLLALGALLLVTAGDSTGQPEAQRAFVLTALVIFGCTALLFIVFRYTRLELTQRGIALYQVGYTLETGWDNVAAFYEGAGEAGLVLHRAMPGRGAALLRRFRHTGMGVNVRFYSGEQVQLLAARRFIPIGAFAYWLEHGRLRADLVSRAPSLRR